MEDEQLEALQERLLEKDKKRLRESDAQLAAKVGLLREELPRIIDGLEELKQGVLREIENINKRCKQAAGY